ncbi:response regulator transcription factor [Gorillibacterium massiliense]|uniref:response regulator transcription factor n=1 Tax=Gorillibacterium massiliense TaxID=1280390 RepID=UPI0004BC1AB2|nr:response regulator transcription factor [Gorillibacterium massiliense]
MNKPHKILIIEDEEKISRLLELELTHEGYIVERTETGRSGLDKSLEGQWDLILLDIMIPELNGLEVLRRLRHANCETPVILLTARGETPDVVSGLDLGANDYIKKPFQIEEVLARLRACIRNDKRGVVHQLTDFSSQLLAAGDLTLNRQTREVIRDKKQIGLTPKEYDLLLYLMENKGQILTRDQIMTHVWGFDFVGDTNSVDVYIRYLRIKVDYPFKKNLIHTSRGVGYFLKEIQT